MKKIILLNVIVFCILSCNNKSVDSLDNQKYHAIRLKINKNFEYIKTSHISLVNDAWEQGYEIFIFNGNQEINIRDCTVKELRPIHNIQRLLQANQFENSGVEF